MKSLLICAFLAVPALAAEGPPMKLSTAAEDFLATLDEAGKAKAALPFSSDERENYRYTPRDRAGLSMKEMQEPQREAAKKLLDVTLSEKGKLKVRQIMMLEGVLAELENNPTHRDPGKYFFAIFGTPGDEKGWGWRYEGHHVSINVTEVAGTLSVTPSFLGANPAEVREGPQAGTRVLGEEEDVARALVSTLLAAGKKDVIFSEKPPAEIVTGEERKVTALEPVGIPAADMTEAQRTALMELVSVYTGRYHPRIATRRMEEIQNAGIDKIRFGWAGGTKPGEAYYYRIQGPEFLMECANTQNDANHIHAVWRDFKNDFGRDLLREHLTDGHAE